MNKKLFLGMFAAAGMLLATSCSNDELDVVQSGNEAQVTFNLGTEGSIATRAISDGTGAKKLVYAVYKLDAEGTPILQKVVGSDDNSQFVDEEAFDNGLTETVSVTLAKGQTYQVAFWAQNPSCTAYTTTDLTNVGVSYDNATNNDELRDAFFKTVEFTVNGSTSIDVVLKRPFAQINVGVTAEDWEAAVASGITVEESSVVIKNAANQINLLTGEVSGSTEVNYALNAIPNDPAILKVDADGDGEDEEYNWLSMSYILVADDNTTDVNNTGVLGDERTTLEGLQYTFTPNSGNPIEFKEGLAGAPVQRNWRTNILGKILTGDIQFNITIDPAYNGDIIYPNGTIEQELEFAATFGGEVTLTQDVNLTKTLNVTADMILNLNGKTISGPQEGRDANDKRIHAIVNNANLTINGGKVASIGNNAGSAIYNATGATLTIENVEVSGAPKADGSWPSYAINNYGNLTVKSAIVKSYHGGIATGGNGVTVIDNATVDVGQGVANGITSWGLYVFEQGQLTVNAGKFENTKTDTNVNGGGYLCTSSTGETIINGGVFDNAISTGLYVNNGKLIIKGGTFDKDVTSYVAEGYAAVENADGTWTVKEGKAVSTVDDLVSALGNPDVKAIFLSSDIELTNGLVFGAATPTVRSTSSTLAGRDVVIDGNGSTITFTAGTNSRLIDVTKETEGMNLTLKNITIENKISWVQRVINYNTYGTLTLDNVTIKHAENCSANYAVNLPGVSHNCTVVINNCNIGATANALNIWGKNVKADVTNSDLYVIDNSAEESYSVIALNNDGAGSSADGTVVNVTGGSLKATGTHAEQSDAVRNNTETGVVNISTSTEVVGEIEEMVAIVHYEGSTDYYSKATLAGAIQTAKETNAAGIRLIRDVECTEALLIDSNLKIEGNGHTLTTSASRAFRLTTGDIAVEISNLNIVSTAKMVYPNDVRGISLDGNLKNIGLTLNDCTIDFTDETACDWTYGVNISGGSDTYTLNINGGTYEGANVVNIWGSNNIVNIEGATLNSNYKPNEQYSGVCVKLADTEGSGNKVTVKKTTFNATGGNAIAFDDDAVEGANTITQENNTDNTATAKE